MRIISWNVNGLRACAKRGFGEWLSNCGADVVGVQELRATADQIGPELANPSGWHAHFCSAERAGYSGVALYTRQPPSNVETRLGRKEFDAEGRLQIAQIGALTLANVYFPNGAGKDRDNSRIPFKLAFYRKLFRHLKPTVDAGAPVIVMGDFNTAHAEIDLARPKQNQKTSGFCLEEREEITRWLKAGWVDTFRHLHPDTVKYSWWSQRFGVREKNVGWRNDLVLASPGALPFLADAFIHDHVQGSDHCPIGIDLDPAVMEGR